jgi:hypothetical protein
MAPVHVVAITRDRPVAEDLASQWTDAQVASQRECGLFLAHHQLLL